jgi:hypothetical protein
MDDMVWNQVTGMRVRYIKRPAAWMFRHLHEIQYANISRQSNGGATVDLYVNDYCVLRWHWGSCALANKFIRRHIAKVNYFDITNITNFAI